MQIDDAREFIKFLHGAVPWNGTWFGEYAPGERGAYWWRKHLDEAIAALIAAPAAPQQAEPVAQIGWADEFGNLFPMAAWKPAQRTHHDAHKTAWRPVFLHPPRADAESRSTRAALIELTVECEKSAAENERLRAALDSIRQYGSDTLSGRTDGPDDRKWQRDAVLEMTNRASRALRGE